PRSASAPAGGTSQPSGSTARGRALVMVSRSEIPSLSAKPIEQLGLTSEATVRLFNAGLALDDDKGIGRPYLAEKLPQLDTESWRLFPDGSMETTYHLRQGLTWQDGAPLSSDDFLFSWEVYSVPELGWAAITPLSLMDQVTTPDPLTLVIHWKQLYADAGSLHAQGGTAWPCFPPLPRHALDDAFRQASAQAGWESFAALPFWSVGYIGAGPYKVDRWEQGAFLEATAFDAHALGRAKIDRVRLIWSPDF